MNVKPSLYHGVTFRSRTEARWAAFFDCLSLKYDYEPGYFSDAWGTYTPDFYIFREDELEIGPFWVEVKGQTPSAQERRKLRNVCDRVRCEGLLLVGWPEESGEAYYYNPWRDGQDYVIRQARLDLLLGADRTCFAQARATYVDDALTPRESPLLSVTEPCDISTHPGLPMMATPKVFDLLAASAPPTDEDFAEAWRAQWRALITLWEGNKNLSAQMGDLVTQAETLKKAYTELVRTNKQLQYILYAISGLCLLAAGLIAIFA